VTSLAIAGSPPHSSVAGSAGNGQIAFTPPDSVTLLRIYAVALLVVPAGLTAVGLGSAGTVAGLVALGGGWLWAMGNLVPRLGLSQGFQPVRLALFAFGLTIVASFAAAQLRTIDWIEARAADRGMITIAACIGIALLAADGIPNRRRLDALLRTLVGAGSVLAVVGILQFTRGLDLTSYVRLPGFSLDPGFIPIAERSSFNRVAGTTYHPIEFSAVLTMLLPLAIHYAYSTGQKRWWLATGLLATGVPMSVSRTGTIAVVAVALILVPTWDWQRLKRACVASALFAVVMKVAIPGLLGTMRSLVLDYKSDPSVQGRTNDYAVIGPLISERPWFGRGFMTFIPDRYLFLDNQYLLGLIETGIIGVVVLVALFLVGICVARGARRRATDAATRDLGQSLAAALFVTLVTCATFDFLSFPTARGLSFLLVGCAGALWRLQRDEATDSSTPAVAVR
jgi:O-Antigen ligase